MKVMLVVPHLSDGGGERIVSDLSLGLQADEIVLVLFERKVSYPFNGRLVSLDLAIDRRSVFSRAAGFLRRIRAFRQLLRRERPDAVISFMGEANLINAVVSRRPILSVHNLPGLCELNQTGMPAGLGMRVQSAIATALAGVFYRRARTIVAVSEHVQSELLRKFRLSPKQVAVIPNAVNVEEIQRRASEQADCPWISNGLVVVTAGRLTAAKGQWHLIRAVGEARKQVPVKLVILGSGELEEYLRMLVRHLGLEKDVHFLGWQPNPHKFMARADIFVLPSLSEGFGLVLLEAMACGLPVVTANCPGPPAEIVAPGVDPKSIQRPVFGDYGVVVPALDGRMLDAAASVTIAETMLSDVLVQMARQPALRQKYRAAAARRVADYGYQEFIFKYQMLIGNISRTT